MKYETQTGVVSDRLIPVFQLAIGADGRIYASIMLRRVLERRIGKSSMVMIHDVREQPIEIHKIHLTEDQQQLLLLERLESEQGQREDNSRT